jgi:hypothetical protein
MTVGSVPSARTTLPAPVPLALFSIAVLFAYEIDSAGVYVDSLGFVAAAYCLAAVLCLRLVRKIPRLGDDVFDPGLFFLVFVTMTLAPVAVTAAVAVPIESFEVASLNALLSKVTSLHIVLIVSFALAYYVLNVRFRPAPPPRIPEIWLSSIWIWVAIALTVLTFSVEGIMGVLFTRATSGESNLQSQDFFQNTGLLQQQALLHLRRMRGASIIFAVGVFVARAPTLRRAYLRLMTTVGGLGLIYFAVFASRGFLFSTALGAACYADIVRWRGRFLNWKTLLIVVFLGTALLQLLSFGEAFLLSGFVPSGLDMARLLVLDFGIVENSAIVVDWVDNSTTPLQHGKNYLTALVSLLPTQIRGQVTSLPTWFVAQLSQAYRFDYVQQGVGFGFSAVAEGYLNWRTLGVAVHGVALAVVALLIRLPKLTNRLLLIRPFLFSQAIMLSYVLFRMDTEGSISRYKNLVIDVGFLIIVVLVLLALTQRRRPVPEGAST